ncbi:MAG: PilZ domain-containing protein [Chitinispirillaceae bacterium]|jgi:hypothetical protein|nr:PilZ domain-containing protein [Chitinispirillaceae bacterium]
MSDKRKLKRRELLCNYRIIDMETGEAAGWLVDMNAGGMKLTGCLGEYKTGQKLALSFEFGEDILSKNSISFSARVRWSQPDVNPELTAIGLQFADIAADDFETIIGFMARYAL